VSVTVELTYDMSKALGVRRIDVEGARTVRDVLRLTRERFAGRTAEFDRLTRVTAVAVNGVILNYRRGLRTGVADGDTVMFLKAAAGG
jgi:molybdopterin converting factor small subunit